VPWVINLADGRRLGMARASVTRTGTGLTRPDAGVGPGGAVYGRRGTSSWPAWVSRTTGYGGSDLPAHAQSGRMGAWRPGRVAGLLGTYNSRLAGESGGPSSDAARMLAGRVKAVA